MLLLRFMDSKLINMYVDCLEECLELTENNPLENKSK